MKKVCSNSGNVCQSDADCSGGSCVDEATVSFTTVLKPLGFLSHRAYPGDELELKVVALRSSGEGVSSETDIVPLSGEVITWSLVAGSSDAQLASEASLTNVDGIGVITVNTGSVQGVSFQVRASVAGADALTFSIQVQVDTRELRLLTPATLDSVVERTERVRVQWLRAVSGTSGVPVAGEKIQVELVGGARDGARLTGEPAHVQSVTTDLAGVATIRFQTGTVARDYELVFCGNQSCANTQARALTVKVATRGNTTGCTYFTDCDPGYLCVEGACELAATYCETKDDCPAGYVCGAGRQCEVGTPGQSCTDTSDCNAGEICGTKDSCIDEDGCLADTDCPQDYLCNEDTGACTPDPTVNIPNVDVRGDWLTRYNFDISDALPGFFHDGLGPVVRFLNLAFRSELQIGGPFGQILEGLLDALIAQYVPSWVQTVVSILDDFITVFQRMEVEGLMTLYQPGNPVGSQVSGEEEWTSAQFFVPSFCPGGLNEFANNPRCGAIDVVMHPEINLGYSNNSPDVGVNVHPFTGQVVPPPQNGSQPHYTLQLFNREIDMELSQLINVLLDLIVATASNGQWYYFEDFLLDIVPCYELQLAIDDLVYDLTDGSVTSVPGIEQACEAAANLAVTQLTNVLGDVQLRVLTLDFNTNIAVHDNGDAVSPVAQQLGNPPNPASQSVVMGTMRAALVFKGDLNGSWWFGVAP